MSLSRVYSGLIDGVDGEIVKVETHLDQGLPGVHIVGLPDQAVKESRERIRSAIKETEFDFPNRKITVNLSPADKAKQGSTYDLPIAVGLLMADNQLEIPQSELESVILTGEIALDGSLQPIPRILSLTLEAADSGFERIIIPRENYHEAEATDLDVQPVTHLREAVGILEGTVSVDPPPSPSENPERSYKDFSEVKGQESAKRGLSLAAAGFLSPAKPALPIRGSCFWTNFPSSSDPSWKPCANPSRKESSTSPAPRPPTRSRLIFCSWGP
jgi:magnesium chelatase family protein